jgi:hypothetical protein
MRAVLGDDGLLVLTSRNWERVRAAGSRVEVGEELVERAGRHALVVYAWSIPAHGRNSSGTAGPTLRARPWPA